MDDYPNSSNSKLDTTDKEETIITYIFLLVLVAVMSWFFSMLHC